MNIGYVGSGSQGLDFVRGLLREHRVHVWRGEGGEIHALEKEGAIGNVTLADLSRNCEVTVLCAESSSEAQTVLFGEGGLVQTAASRKILIDQTRNDPAETRAIAAKLLESEIVLVDVALHREANGFDDGAFALFVGGPLEAVESARSILQTVCPTVVHCGEVGNGHAMKVITSAIAACNRLITYESTAMGVKGGLAVEHISAVINKSSGSSSASERILPALVARERTADLTIEEVLLDLNLASRLAMVHGVPMLIGNLVRGAFEAAFNELGDTATLDDLAQLYEKSSDLQFSGASK